MDRRAFLSAAMTVGMARAAAAVPIIDTHIHLFDTTRPQGVPWPDKKQEVLFRPALPDRYRQIAGPLGVTGAIVVEASPWLEDNQWVLDLAATSPIIVGTVGNLDPGHPEFGRQLERFHRNPLYKGIRYGNLWERMLGAELRKQEFIAGLKLLAQANLTLDTANPNPELIAAIVRVSDLVPNLRIVIDHLPQMQMPEARRHLRELGKRPQVYAKLSAVFRRVNGEVPRDVSFYRATLDEITGVLGEDRVVYGSDWPNSDLSRPYPDVLGVVQEYFAPKSQAAREKYFWKNSQAAYRWTKRDPSQPE